MKKAFTLTEVLVSLAIIGVISALTLPAVNRSTNNATYTQGCKRALVVLSDAFELAQGGTTLSTSDTVNNNYAKLKPYLRITQECKNQRGCFAYPIKRLKKNTASSYFSETKFLGKDTVSFKLADGTNIAMTQDNGSSYDGDSNSIILAVDVNGDKGPNMLGRDVFIYLKKGRNIVPAGNSNKGQYCTTASKQGMHCSAKVLAEGKMSY